MQNGIALYKGPAKGWWNRFRDSLVKLWTWSKYSHIELVIDGVCYSSSPRDGGVRAKKIDIYSGRWDLFPLDKEKLENSLAREWFQVHMEENYDWMGIVRFVFPFIPHRSNQWFCFEAVAAALGLPKPHRWAGRQFVKWLNEVNAEAAR